MSQQLSSYFNQKKDNELKKQNNTVDSLQSSFCFNFHLQDDQANSPIRVEPEPEVENKKKEKNNVIINVEQTPIEEKNRNVSENMKKDNDEIDFKLPQDLALKSMETSMESSMQASINDKNVEESLKKKKKRKKKKKKKNSTILETEESPKSLSYEEVINQSKTLESSTNVVLSQKEILEKLKHKKKSNRKRRTLKMTKTAEQMEQEERGRLGTTSYLSLRKETGNESEIQRMQLRYGKGRRNLNAPKRIQRVEDKNLTQETFSFDFHIQ